VPDIEILLPTSCLFEVNEGGRGGVLGPPEISSSVKGKNVLHTPCESSRGCHLNFLPTPMMGWVGDKPAGLRVFLVQSGRFSVVQKFVYFELGQKIWVLAPRIWILAPLIWIFAPTSENRVISKGVWESGWVSQDFREVSSSLSGKNIPPTPGESWRGGHFNCFTNTDERGGGGQIGSVQSFPRANHEVCSGTNFDHFQFLSKFWI